jgi:hypothetical protein
VKKKGSVFLSLLAVCFVHGDSNEPSNDPKWRGDLLRIGESIVADHAAKSFDASLEAKENAEFLLLPAHLVQESIAANGIIFPR